MYENGNPEVDQPRWSKERERVSGDGGLLRVKRKTTLKMNGYAEQVEKLYQEKDLRSYL
ncbi:hypothetical protein HIR72_01985 [Pasteurella multocida]|uniref:hypothetical protein n=1 Tax=Pasteurella multocida TaxID=747 RepID=UPI001461422A|nr:hypothetical protein [Pasteurella multocida]NMR59464.1 hypothetical protein [Pasteurella multocida]